FVLGVKIKNSLQSFGCLTIKGIGNVFIRTIREVQPGCLVENRSVSETFELFVDRSNNGSVFPSFELLIDERTTAPGEEPRMGEVQDLLKWDLRQRQPAILSEIEKEVRNLARIASTHRCRWFGR